MAVQKLRQNHESDTICRGKKFVKPGEVEKRLNKMRNQTGDTKDEQSTFDYHILHHPRVLMLIRITRTLPQECIITCFNISKRHPDKNR